MTQESQPVSTRRAALAGIGLAGLAATLTACGGSSGSPASAPATGASGGSGGSAAAGSGGNSPGDGALGATSEVPVGGGKIFTSAQVVVTQPAAGEYKAFSAVCTHQQCLVDQVANGTIDCPCHGSQFSAKDGSVITGPASSPLPSKQISVSSGHISLA